MKKRCVFCDIIAGKIPCYKAYEDKETIAFLDVHPAVDGHTLVVPKKHRADLFSLSEKELGAVMRATQKTAALLKRRLGAQGVNLLNASGTVAQQSVPHFHMHILPRKTGDGVDTEIRKPQKNLLTVTAVHKKITAK